MKWPHKLRFRCPHPSFGCPLISGSLPQSNFGLTLRTFHFLIWQQRGQEKIKTRLWPKTLLRGKIIETSLVSATTTLVFAREYAWSWTTLVSVGDALCLASFSVALMLTRVWKSLSLQCKLIRRLTLPIWMGSWRYFAWV